MRVGWEWGGRRGFWGDDGRGLGVGGGMVDEGLEIWVWMGMWMILWRDGLKI